MSQSIRNIVLVFATAAGAVSANTITTIDVPGATTTPLSGTQLFGISNNGVAVGYYSDATGTHGFEVLPNGTLVYPFDAPGGNVPVTTFLGVNNSGTVVGVEGNGLQQPSFTFSSGVYNAFTIPGCGNTYSGQGINGINDNGDVVGGCYASGSSVASAFLEINGSSAVLLNAAGALDTVGRGINNLDQIVGYYDTSSGAERYYGFIRNSDGTYTTVGVPGSYSTELSSINDAGTFVGYWDVYGGYIYSFYGNSPASLTSFAVPGATYTYIEGINDSGEIVGYYVDSSGVDHGFISSVATPEPSSVFTAVAGVLVLALLKWHRS
jgi:hypothetical protein